MRYVAIIACLINADSEDEAKEKAQRTAYVLKGLVGEVENEICLYCDPQLEISESIRNRYANLPPGVKGITRPELEE
jgi:hypothetical protein